MDAYNFVKPLATVYQSMKA